MLLRKCYHIILRCYKVVVTKLALIIHFEHPVYIFFDTLYLLPYNNSNWQPKHCFPAIFYQKCYDGTLENATNSLDSISFYCKILSLPGPPGAASRTHSWHRGLGVASRAAAWEDPTLRIKSSQKQGYGRMEIRQIKLSEAISFYIQYFLFRIFPRHSHHPPESLSRCSHGASILDLGCPHSWHPVTKQFS